ncbi:uncharacterized protein BJ212DRAFT_1300706 [Suillus subaureus]|uniref:Fungal-type protein kinase domain-containing protein n=1 Tax=Suillus subaureus TaxID=48587 RepID=A0A9P7E9M1_9AGAM|nr:uncharacterized protein BJ212DRAFT_1300706 [Suillus subaureus]KAG1814424.1 hypothetical protein BJ212DRAFT_1300706 [Suillus subaureus]
MTTEHIVAGLLNALTAALSGHDGLKTKQVNHVWSGAHSTTPIKGEDIPCKPDIVMSDEPNPGWGGIKVVIEIMSNKYQPGKCAVKSLDTKVYIILKHQPWRCFTLMLSLCNHYCELCVHVYDHSGSAISPPFHISWQKNKFLQILSLIVFSNGKCIGFNMMMNFQQLKLPVLFCHSIPPRRLCLQKKRDTHSESGTQAKTGDAASGKQSDDEEYTIKDHWVLGNADDEDILNEVAMLKAMQGVHGAPELVEFSKVKLLTAICNIVAMIVTPVQQEVHQQGILHHDCSLHNAMIKDADGNSLGMLIDWEFTVTITPENTYTIGGTGTILFMLWQLLQQVKKFLVSNTAKKGVLSSSPLAIKFVKQDYLDDLESLFYVFSWICIKYSSPLGVECHLNPSKVWLLHVWSNWNIVGCFENKVAFYTGGEGEAALQVQFDDYFQDLIPLTLEWMDLLRLNFPVQIGSVDSQILDKHITGLLKGEPELGPERLLHKRLVDKHKQDVHASGQIMKEMDCTTVKKCGLNDKWTVKPYSLHVLPLLAINSEVVTHRSCSHDFGNILAISIMPPHPQATSSPKRMKAKRKVAESGILALTGQGKKVQTADEVGLVSLQLPSNVNAPPICHSGHPGTGTGGRNAQLEKAGAALNHTERAVAAIHSISNSTGSTIMSSYQKGEKAKTSSVPDLQAEPDITCGKSSHQSLQLGLLLCEMGGHFRFQTPQGSPPIVPPGTEPDLQALNNSYVVIMIAKKDTKYCACSAVQSLARGHQSSMPPSATLDLLSHPLSTACIVLTLSKDYLDLSLRTVSSEPGTNHSLQQSNSNDLDMSGSGESSAGGEDNDNSINGDNAGEREFGWAEVGFSWEPEPSLVHVTSTLAPDFDFQYSCDKDDMNTKQTLAFDKPSSNEIALEGAQCVPEVSELELGGSQEPDGSQDPKNDKGPVNTQQPAKAKCSPDGPKPT